MEMSVRIALLHISDIHYEQDIQNFATEAVADARRVFKYDSLIFTSER